ncbi:hypothetical protein ACFTWF_44670 [Rhodococcus sp. NPDC056960]|uniref:hypothetical protein n=1 Tax=Rhodococcus sp. NPDC056960 TaxID=3345982 RepID=UPI0036394134
MLCTGMTLTGVAFCPVGHTLYLGDDTMDATSAQIVDDQTLISGLARTSRAHLYVTTGIESGQVSLRLCGHDTRPAPRTTDVDWKWEDVGELSLLNPSSALSVCYFTGVDDDSSPPCHSVRLPPSGDAMYRVRVHARGRDLFFGRHAEDPVESYLIDVWPEPWSEPMMILRTSNYRFFGRAEGIPWNEGGK